MIKLAFDTYKANEAVAGEILAKSEAIVGKIDSLVKAGRKFNAAKAKVDVHEVVSKVSGLLNEVDLTLPWVGDDLMKLASRCDELHGLFFKKAKEESNADYKKVMNAFDDLLDDLEGGKKDVDGQFTKLLKTLNSSDGWGFSKVQLWDIIEYTQKHLPKAVKGDKELEAKVQALHKAVKGLQDRIHGKSAK